MKPVARIVTRLQGEGDGLFVGVTLQGHNLFKPNTVYELRECFGELVLKEVGESIVAAEHQTVAEGSPVGRHWSENIGDIIGYTGQVLFLSKEEYAVHLKQVEDEYRERNL